MSFPSLARLISAFLKEKKKTQRTFSLITFATAFQIRKWEREKGKTFKAYWNKGQKDTKHNE